MILVLACTGELGVQFGDLAPHHAGGRFGSSRGIAGGEHVPAEIVVRLLGRAHEDSQALDLGTEFGDLR